MKRRKRPYWILLALAIIVVLTFVTDYSALLKTQLLRPPEVLTSVKLLRQETDPVQFDIFYDELKTERPADVSITIVKAIVREGDRFQNRSAIVEKILLTTGQEKIATGVNAQDIVIRNIVKQNTTKLGTLITNLSKAQYVSLEYDIGVKGKRQTLTDNPLPADFPLGYFPFRNPTSELLYIRTPEFHTLLAPEERIFTRSQEIPHGALLLGNTITTLQELSGLRADTLIAQPIQRDVPKLEILGQQLILPQIPSNDLNTLILRYRTPQSRFRYSAFLLSASKDTTLPVPIMNLLDFATEVEYSFAYLGQGGNVVNLDFPFESLLSGDQFPVFYRTNYVSLVPEITKNLNALNITLNVSTAPHPSGLYIGLLTRTPLKNLQETLNVLEQKLPILLFEDDSETFVTSVGTADQIPFFNLIGKLDQIWSVATTDRNLSLVSKDFVPIPLLPRDEQIADLEIVNHMKGDKLFCFIKTEKGSFSTSPIAEHIAVSGHCVQSAKRAGFIKGTIYPVVFRATKKVLIGLNHFDFDETITALPPEVKNYDPFKKTFTLSSVFKKGQIKLVVSPNISFESIATLVPEQKDPATFSIPALPSCEVFCYLKVAAFDKDDEKGKIAVLSDTLLFASNLEPLIQLCFSNQRAVEKLYDPKELGFQVLLRDGKSKDMTFNSGSGCYEFLLTEEASTPSSTPLPAATPSTPAVTTPKRSLRELVTNLPSLPPKTIVLHSKGLTNNHITLPPQRHYLVLNTDSEHQLLLTSLAFEHVHLQAETQSEPPVVLKTSYQISLLGQKTKLFAKTRGTVILHRLNQTPYFFQTLDIRSPLNETLFFPGLGSVLSIPNTIRFLPSEEALVQNFSEEEKALALTLDVPEQSKLRLFIENLFRPEIQVEKKLEEGISFDLKSGFFTLQNPIGTLSIPLQLAINKPTEKTLYEKTFPTTPIPSDLDLAFLDTKLIMKIRQPADIPKNSVLNPITLATASMGFRYEEKVDLKGVEKSTAFQVLSHRFLNKACSQIFTFDEKLRTLSGLVPTTTLEECLLEIPTKYLVKKAPLEMEVLTTLTYQIPLVSGLAARERKADVVLVPVNTQKKEVSQVISFRKAIEEVVETTAQFISKGNEGSLITAIDQLSIVFDAINQQLVISGSAENLTDETSRYLRGIEQATGKVALFEFRFFPVKQQAIILPLTQGFPNRIDVPQILRDQGFTEKESTNISLVTSTLPTDVEIGENSVITIFATPELQNQVFSALVQKDETTPSAFVEFESRIAKKGAPKEPTIVRIDFQLQVQKPVTITLSPFPFKADTSIAVDLRIIAGEGVTVVTPQLPSFLVRIGNQLIGRTPKEAQEINLLIQDYTFVRNIIIPLKIEAPQVPSIPPPPPEAAEVPLRGAAEKDACFPDIGDQPLEYREAICLAAQFKIISGSGGLFFPNIPMNRAEVSKVLVTGPLVILGLLKEEEIDQLAQAYPLPSFPDVPSSAWFYGFVESVRGIGIVTGHPDGTFRPGNSLNRAEAAKIIVNTLRQLEPKSFTEDESLERNTFRGDQWFAPFVRILNKNGGDLPEAEEAEGNAEPISRAQFVYNLIILLDSKAPELRKRIN